ncbi:alpha/beta hydrolase [Pseudomonas lopnurensis]|uniref:alpha/beta hydrolase n=1 Tax=Pseudomonas lopnurensis TaxID=1477517 RepID=UPI001879A26B|nr:alpha/beta hydrolase [Pseudomonas lopnurensis]MBE7374339.1 alpha/beta hydrolase [Pseudomonas lopnurensis]
MSHYLYGANIQANGIRQHYLRYGGQGLPIILIPGITSPAVTWGFVAERLGRHFDVYVLDVRGRGLSEASPSLDYSLDAQAADVAALAEALGLECFAVVGHSMGGRIAIRMARAHRLPGLERLVLIDPPVSGPGRRPYPSALPWYVDSIRQSLGGMSAEDMRAFCPSWTDEQLRLRAEWLHTCDERAVVASYRGFHEDDIHQDLPHIGVPTLLMVAGRGDVLLPEDIEAFQGLLPDLTVARVPNAGHMIPWDDEEGFYQAFGTFLGKSI